MDEKIFQGKAVQLDFFGVGKFSWIILKPGWKRSTGEKRRRKRDFTLQPKSPAARAGEDSHYYPLPLLVIETTQTRIASASHILTILPIENKATISCFRPAALRSPHESPIAVISCHILFTCLNFKENVLAYSGISTTIQLRLQRDVRFLRSVSGLGPSIIKFFTSVIY